MTDHAHFCTFSKDGSLVRGCRACERLCVDPRGMTDAQLQTLWDWYEKGALLSDLDARVVKQLERSQTLARRMGWIDYPWNQTEEQNDDDSSSSPGDAGSGDGLDASTQRSVDRISGALRA